MKTHPNNKISPDAGLEEQAWVWLRLLHSGDVRQWDLDGFKRWVRTSPQHQAAFSAVRHHWELVKSASGAMAPVAAADLGITEGKKNNPRLAKPGRRLFMGTAITAAAAAAVAVVHPPFGLWAAPGEWGADDRTVIGEQRSFELNERVQLTLNTQTSIRRQVVADQVAGIELLGGEAAVDLASAGRVFSVSAGVGKSTSSEGRFEVRYLEGKVCVTCLAGTVSVSHPAGERTLTARQQTVYDRRALSGIAMIEPQLISAWRHGEIKFNEVALGKVIDEINRYRPGKVVLMNDAVRNKPVSGSFYIASLDLALSQLQRSFDLQARSLPGGLYLLS
ncbi:FecR family protein [Herbaspirillum chlorophenolicum]|uniref:FecR family protein n=1 Tax=Herbaspirillum chlorophenolicum TaxID=211589 RepID=UPI00067BA609|nr:FecR domain-containing protein [Herbaspirillum chlorophenolicum]